MMNHNLNVFYFHPTHHEELLMKLSELSVAVAAIADQLTKVRDEILGKIAALEGALTDVDLPEEAIGALNILRDGVQAIDDIVPDATPEPVVPE